MDTLAGGSITPSIIFGFRKPSPRQQLKFVSEENLEDTVPRRTLTRRGAMTDRNLLLIFGTETGNAEELAEDAAHMAKKYDLNPTVIDYDAVSESEDGCMIGVNFAVLALGDTAFEFFCESGKEWDSVLEEKGGKRTNKRIDCDTDYDDYAEEWIEETLSLMKDIA